MAEGYRCSPNRSNGRRFAKRERAATLEALREQGVSANVVRAVLAGA